MEEKTIKINVKSKEKLFKCLSCGHVFKSPKIISVPQVENPIGNLGIGHMPVFYPIEVCPKCKSGKFVELDLKHGREGETP